LLLSGVFQCDFTGPILTQAMTRWARARSCLSRLPSRATPARVWARQEFSRAFKLQRA